MVQNHFLLQKKLILFFIFCPFLVHAETVKLPLFGKGHFVSYTELSPLFPELSSNHEKSTGIVKLQSAQGKLQFRLGASFYVFDEKIIKVSKPALLKNGDLYLSVDIFESILLNLISYDVRYKIKESEVLLDIPREPIAKRNINVKAIVIDAGHGGKDPGTSDASGYFEKDVSLAVAKYVYLYLRKYYPEIRIHLTRKNDTFIELEDRSKQANSLLKDTRDSIFISLHCNASLNEKASGFEVYYLSQTPSTEQARETALIENRYIGPHSQKIISSIQSQMLSSLTQRRSKKLAIAIEEEFGKGVESNISSRGVKKADFSVLRGSLMPAVLIEMGYLTNPEESKLLKDKSFQKRIARSIIKGIRGYAQTKD
ncbi:N-acetylmuramoyl-L-alanine amidase [Leptospira ryugenii]|uniref:N-acetylmuramoyl-L-alanine amidase n=1 Tax=Leptospira ryugenii TaxID=1917863 RepID=A0A2P2DYE7_9LEPT|nr:N-acetylmuramoyl-L-alanine amidase [Leptospira ryugenii]GBF49632.1 N-acetylmuramoyl-L-alanine amidase [Leptospira ryugenii]